MAELRWILLIAGLVFLAALAAWEKRKPRQARRDGGAQAPSRAEPTLAAGSQVPSEVHDAHAMHAAHAADTAYPAPASAAALSARAAAGNADGRRPIMLPPRIDLPAMEAIRDESMMAEVDALPVFDFHPMAIDAEEAQQAPQAEAELEAAQQPEPAPGPATPLVDWPPDGERRVVALRIVAASEQRLSGRDVRLAIAACGFVHGRFGIFHQPDADGRALLSIASLSKPGVLDPINMDFQRLTGVSLFTVLPGPLPQAAAVDHLIDVARELSDRLPARLQDEHGHPLDGERLEDLRASMQRLSPPGLHAEPAA
ncbi:MAG TPA: cell division protein ZipA C-terminal FtsZ-binding domain-containing protein [Steroidobacteraceae bacterium]